MKVVRRSVVLLVALAVLVLAAPLAALPPSCGTCTCLSSCTQWCTAFGEIVTCGEVSFCRGNWLCATKVRTASTDKETGLAALFAQAETCQVEKPVTAALTK